MRSYYPSKTRFYCVHVSQQNYVLYIYRFTRHAINNDVMQVPGTVVPYLPLEDSESGDFTTKSTTTEQNKRRAKIHSETVASVCTIPSSKSRDDEPVPPKKVSYL